MFIVVDWNVSILALIAMIGTSFGAWLTYKTAQINKTVGVIHKLTNSAMTLQKKSLYEVTTAKAAITKDPLDIQAAEVARKAWLESEAENTKANLP